jgi:putative endonuclease
MYWTYILKSRSTGQYYIGYTADLADRIRRYCQGLTQTTRRRKGPWDLVYRETFKLKSEAIKREHEIKNWKDKKRIERLIE